MGIKEDEENINKKIRIVCMSKSLGQA